MEPSLAIFGIFSKEDKNRMPSKAEVAEHDRLASGWFARGEQASQAGKTKRALSAYERIGKKYYFSQYAPEAQFRVAELLLGSGEPLEAFAAYQALIDRYRGSKRFQRSVEQQYNIAVNSLTQKNSSVLGIVPKKTSRDRVIQMFETIVRNAPSSVYAANSYYYVGRIYEGRKDYEKAVAAFQKVVDDYPKSQKAPQAQLRIGQIYGTTAKRPDNPTNLRESREAYEDFITNFPEHDSTGDAYAQLDAISEKEAKKSLNLAKYYERKGNLKGAAIYYNDVLRSGNAALKQEARQGLGLISQRDPEALKIAQIDTAATRTPAHERLKNQRNYVGPPAPDLAANTPTKKRRSLVPSKLKPQALPTAPAEEPSLPTRVPGEELNVDPLVPTPPPTTSDDVLGGVDPSLSPTSPGEEVDIDSLLPPIESYDSSTSTDEGDDQ